MLQEETKQTRKQTENLSAFEYIVERIQNTSLEQLLDQVTKEFQEILTEVVQYLLEHRQRVEQTVVQVKQLQLNWVKIEKKVAQVDIQLRLLEKEVAKDLESTAKSLEEKRRYTNCKIALEALQRKNKTLRNAWRLVEKLERGDSLPEEEETENLLRNLVLEIGKAKGINYEEVLLDTELADKVEENLKNLCSRTEEKLQWWFLTCLSQVELAGESLRRCLECCKDMQLTNKVENWFAEAFVEPFILERVDCAAETSWNGLHAMKNAVNELLQYRFLENMKQPDSSIYWEFSFINRSVLPVVVDCIKDRIIQLENLKDPDYFYRLYIGIEEIFASLEQFERTVYPQDSVYKTPEYRSFWDPKLFQTYFEAVELRLANRLEASLFHGQGRTEQGYYKFKCEASKGLKQFLEESWSSKVWILPITGLLVEWSLLGISRYKKYIEDSIERANSAVPSLQSKDLLNLLLDLKYLPSWVDEEFQLDIPTLPNNNMQEIVEDILQLIRTSVKQCSGKCEQIQQLLCNLIVAKCTENLQSLRGILAAYRMTTKPVPKHHSPFVVNILRPLRDALESISNEDEQLKKQIITSVCRELVDRYVTMTTEIVSSVRKAEDTLKRLNLGRSSLANSNENVSDLEKIQRQLELDWKKLCQELNELGFFVSDDSLLFKAD